MSSMICCSATPVSPGTGQTPPARWPSGLFFFSSRRRHTRSVSAFLLNRSSDLDAGFENQKELTKMQLDNQKEIAEMQNETQKEIAGIQSATSRQNTKDQVYAQNEMLAYQQKESTARVASIMENTNLSKQQ